MEFVTIGIFWVLIFYAFLSEEQYTLLVMLFASMSFGTFAVIPTAMTGGLTITPTPIIALMIIAKTFFVPNGITHFLTLAFSKKHALWMFLFWLAAIFATLFMPRLFQGDIIVMPVRSEEMTYGVPLEPTTQNISQLIYITISIFSVIAFSLFLKDPDIQQKTLKAVCVGAAVAIVTGIIDFISQYVPLDFLLEGFRNASYVLLVDDQVLSGKRVVGLTPEASAYGQLCLAFLTFIYFTRNAIQNDYLREKVAPVLIGLLMLMLWMSTSSAAYVGLGMFACFALLEWVWRANKVKQNALYHRGLIPQAWMLASGIVIFLLTIVFVPSLFDPLLEMLDVMVFQKSDSSSFEERSMWTHLSWQAFLDTYGLGVGLGGTRTSNGVVAMISNVGALGAFLYYGFLLQLFFSRAADNDGYGAVIINGIKWGLLPIFVVEFIVSTTADFGIMHALQFGLILAITSPHLNTQ